MVESERHMLTFLSSSSFGGTVAIKLNRITLMVLTLIMLMIIIIMNLGYALSAKTWKQSM